VAGFAEYLASAPLLHQQVFGAETVFDLKEGEIYVSKYIYRELDIDSCNNCSCYSCCCLQKDVTVNDFKK